MIIIEEYYNLHSLLACSIYDANPVKRFIAVTENVTQKTNKEKITNKENKAFGKGPYQHVHFYLIIWYVAK